ncbi:hypothetical protein RLW55_18875 [Hyphomicrobium sp. B1]|uniref:hypothetical protein n=1 Tax=unclassified Hyphomicrobium TaxID=2619925 RepID=UPI00391A481C
MLLRFRSFMIAFSIVLALAPFSGIAAAALLASTLGCEINDAAMEPCTAHGIDFGPLLTDLLLTASLGQIAFLILTAVLIVWAVVEVFALLARTWQRERGAAVRR